MKKCGIRVIRTAELFNTWDVIEPVPGQFDFEFLDEFFEQAAKREIFILLGTGTASPPYWLHQLDPEVNILSSNGKRYPNNVSYSWACFHNPTYLTYGEKYITKLVERYKNHSNLFAYQIHNEIGLPFMSVDGDKVEMYCYCQHSKQAFRSWVKNKYATLEALNTAWSWSATNTCHTSWEMVEPPYAKPTSWSSVTKYLDFRLFMMDSITKFVGSQNALLKKLDPAHPTSTNIFYMKGEDKLGVMTAIDQFGIAQQVDYLGYDLYPGSGNKLEARPEFASMFLDHGRSAAASAGVPFWLMELESGPINGWALGPHRNTSPADIRRYVTEAVAHNAKMVLFQGYRQWDFQPLCWGGLVDLDGNPTPLTAAAQEMGQFLAENGEYLLQASSGKGEVAILTSKESNCIANGMGHEEFMVEDLRAAYSCLWEMGFAVDFITPEQLAEKMEYKILCAPFLLSLTEENCKDIANYVADGGVFIGEPRLGYVNEKGWYNHSWPPFDLEAVLGVQQKNITAGCTPAFTYGGINYQGHWHKELLQTSLDCEVIARFFDDSPAAVLHPFGKGLGLYIATHSFQARLKNQQQFIWHLLQDVCQKRNICPEVTVEYSNRNNREIDGHLLKAEKQDMLLLTCYESSKRTPLFTKGKKQITITIKNRYANITDAFSKREIPFTAKEGETLIEYTLCEAEYPIWYLNKE